MATASHIQMIDDRFQYGDEEHQQYVRYGYRFLTIFLPWRVSPRDAVRSTAWFGSFMRILLPSGS